MNYENTACKFSPPEEEDIEVSWHSREADLEMLSVCFGTERLFPGEWRLLWSESFLRHDLRLVRGVRSSDLRRNSGPVPLRPEEDLWYDYLICQGNTVWFSIYLEDRDEWYGDRPRLMDIPMVASSAEQFSQGDVENVLEALERAAKRYQAGETPMWSCPLAPCPQSWMKELKQERLVNLLDDKSRPGCGTPVPTDYGLSCGFVRVLEDGWICTMCTLRGARHLARLRTASRKRQMPPRRAQIPLEERRQLFQEGLADNGVDMAKLVFEVMNTPMAVHMEGYPDEHRQLCEAMGEWARGPYSTAAKRISVLMYSPDEYIAQRGLSLMYCLAAPLLGDYWAIQNLLNGRSLDGYPEQRRYRLLGGPARGAGEPRKAPAGTRLVMLPMASFFQGAGVLTRKDYPAWRAQAIRSRIGAPNRCTYGRVLEFAQDSPCPALLNALLIEPYVLIDQP